MGETQQTIPGTADVPSVKVAEAGKAYTNALASWQALGKKADETRATLIEAMEADEIERFEVGKYDVTCVTTATTKIKVKTISQEEK